jgi:pimeloyl-ACP methyl ester carboxylesterase
MSLHPLPASTGTLVFSHANSFPASTYRLLFEHWRKAGWRVIALEKFGHDPAYPVASNWRAVRDELIDFVTAQAPGEKLQFVGHSLGGYLSLLAACRRPELAAGVVLVDSPILTGWRAQSVRVAKAAGFIGRVSPGKVSRTRRQHWPSADDAHRHFAAKHAFARWDPRVLRDFIAAGIEPDPGPDGGVRLAFSREVETRLYNTLPDQFGTLLHRHPPACPVAFIGGTQSVEVRQVGMAATRAVTRGRIDWLDGTHLFPMEQPLRTAKAVLKAIGSGHR